MELAGDMINSFSSNICNQLSNRISDNALLIPYCHGLYAPIMLLYFVVIIYK